jgi:hypothetical protein
MSTTTVDTPQVLLEHHLKALRLPTMLRETGAPTDRSSSVGWEYDKLARTCAVEKANFPNYLLRLTELELLDRDRCSTERRIRQAKFPVVKSLDSFDFLVIPALNKTLVLELTRCEYLVRKENILLLGNSGTHLGGGEPLPLRSSSPPPPKSLPQPSAGYLLLRPSGPLLLLRTFPKKSQFGQISASSSCGSGGDSCGGWNALPDKRRRIPSANA